MILVDLEKCNGCKMCEYACQLCHIKVKDKKARVSFDCVTCLACMKVCSENALSKIKSQEDGRAVCDACPVLCDIKEGMLGACKRFINKAGKIVRNAELTQYEEVAEVVSDEYDPAIRRPLVTGIGAGSTAPDNRPSPYIVKYEVNGVEVVSCVTECAFTVNSIKVKIDTDLPVGEEGAEVTYLGKKVGHVTTEEYGSAMLSLGGLNLTSSKDGIFAVQVVTDMANRKKLKLKVKEGSRLELQVGKAPIINGIKAGTSRVGCGSATLGLFANQFAKVVDEVIIMDHQVTGLFSEHATGRYLKVPPSGVTLSIMKSTPGRYFGEKGDGWGGTNVHDPMKILVYDPKLVRQGLRLLITETTAEKAWLLKFSDGGFQKVDLTPEVNNVMEMIRASCETAKVSAIFTAGVGGSARASITTKPMMLNHAIRSRKARLTVGGAPIFLYPGNGITFAVDVEKVKEGSFSWVPTPAVVVPLEFTMKLQDYIAIGGHVEQIRPLREALAVGHSQLALR